MIDTINHITRPKKKFVVFSDFKADFDCIRAYSFHILKLFTWASIKSHKGYSGLTLRI